MQPPQRYRFQAPFIDCAARLFILAAGAVGATLSVWLFDDRVWGHLFNYSHGHGERLRSLNITAFVGMWTGFGFAWMTRRVAARLVN